MARNRTAPAPAAPAAPAPSISLASLSSLVLLNPEPKQFEQLAADLLATVDPGDHQARMLTELLILALDRLRRAALLEPRTTLPDIAWCRFQALAERNVRSALKELQRHHDRLAPPVRPAGKTRPEVEPRPDPEPEPEPVPESTPEEIAEASANWRRHIALVRSVSDEWPIILRLRREVESVAAWLLDGKSEDELMHWYPGLNRADIAACRSCDAEGLCGPFDTADGPYPPGLPVLDDLPDDRMT